MKKLLLVWLVCMVVAGCPTLSPARADEDESAKIKALMVENYLLYREAWKERDADRMISFEAPDYTSVFSDGRVVSKTETDSTWRDVMTSIVKIHEVRVDIKKVFIEPHRVVVHHKDYTDYDGYWDNSMRRIKITATFSDTWVKYDGIWMLKRSRDLEAARFIDGKRID